VREYELTIIIQPEISEEGSQATMAKLDEAMESSGATRLLCDDLGKRKLAYEIRKFHKGHYYLLSFLDEGSSVPALERILRLEESVLRFLTVKVDDDVTDPEARVQWGKEREIELKKRAEERATREAEEAAARAEAERQAAEEAAKAAAAAAEAAKEAEAAAAEAAEAAGEGDDDNSGEEATEAAATDEAASTDEAAGADEAAGTDEAAGADKVAGADEAAAAEEAAPAAEESSDAGAAADEEVKS
jgi:small subunit ribosomal protein S6